MRARNYCLELYPDDETTDKKLEYIRKNYNYALILHDKDIWDIDVIDEHGELIHEKGQPKKAHYHIMILFENPRSSEQIKKEIGIKHIESCNVYAYSKYLIHKGNEEKHQYSIEEIESNVKNDIIEYIKASDGMSKNTELVKFILDEKRAGHKVTMRELTMYALEKNSLYELQKRAYYYELLTRG